MWGVLSVHVLCGYHVSAEFMSVGCTFCTCVMWISCKCRVPECGCPHVSCGSHVSTECMSVGCTLCTRVMWVSCECRVHECGVYYVCMCHVGLM